MKKEISRTYREHTEEVNELNETLFHTANGYLGVRGCLEEGVPKTWNTMRGTYLNGFYDVIPMKQAENLCNFVQKKDTMVNVADTMTICCKLDGEYFDMNQGSLQEHTRVLNMEDGYTLRRVLWTSKQGKSFEIKVKRMTSFEMLSLFTIQYEVKPLQEEADIEIESFHLADVRNYCNPNDPRMAVESTKNLYVQEMGIDEDMSFQISKTSESGLEMCSAVCHRAYAEDGTAIKGVYIRSQNEVCETFAYKVKPGQSVTLIKYSVYTDSIRNKNVWEAAKRYLKTAVKRGIDYYYEAQRMYLEQFWNRSDMEILGDQQSSNAIAFNMYELLQSVAKDRYCSVAAKGMSGEGYEGHYFWDTEIFVLPFFQLTNPELARTILSYRYQTLEEARANARLLGHKTGALYPWRTIHGAECSGYFVSGTAAYHINADIAYAIISYYLVSGDWDFVREVGEEILIETARIWMDLGNYNSDGRFVLHEVTGPDEYTCMVNNNYYTNCAAKYHLYWTVKFYQMLQEQCATKKTTSMPENIQKLHVSAKELQLMEEAADKMLLPYDESLGINPQDDSFLDKPLWDFEHTPKEDFPLLLHYHPLHLYRFQVCKQADTVMAYYMFEDMQEYDVMCRSYAYYESITTHDSSLSTCIFSIVASRLGMQEKGYEYFGDSLMLDLKNTHNNTKDGIHTANMGGSYMAIVFGFAGLRCKENGISIAPFVPDDWQGYRFNITYRGRVIQIYVDCKNLRVTLKKGDSVSMIIYDTDYLLSEGEPLQICRG